MQVHLLLQLVDLAPVLLLAATCLERIELRLDHQMNLDFVVQLLLELGLLGDQVVNVILHILIVIHFVRANLAA